MIQEQSSEAEPQQLSLAEALSFAFELHKVGHLDEPEALYRKVLKAMPENPDALNYLGVLSHRRGDSEATIALIKRGFAQLPDNADMHNNLRNVVELALLHFRLAANRPSRRFVQLPFPNRRWSG